MKIKKMEVPIRQYLMERALTASIGAFLLYQGWKLRGPSDSPPDANLATQLASLEQRDIVLIILISSFFLLSAYYLFTGMLQYIPEKFTASLEGVFAPAFMLVIWTGFILAWVQGLNYIDDSSTFIDIIFRYLYIYGGFGLFIIFGVYMVFSFWTSHSSEQQHEEQPPENPPKPLTLRGLAVASGILAIFAFFGRDRR